MVDESLYLTTQEAALAVVATAMKKARLLIDTLAVNSLLGGILFSAGGMLHVMVEARCPETYQTNPGFIQLLQGMLYPIGLFYVVIMGVDLFNSNILFFLVGLARGAVSVIDLVISWMVSWWLNLVGNIFVCYVICHYSGVSSLPLFVEGSVSIVETKAAATFVQTLIKGIAGNFFVCLAIYLQLMAKPLHVKFLMMMLPIFTFVAMGFTHSVADMYMIIIGLINGANVSVATAAWKLFLPGALGNMIGGSAFGLMIPWYLHLVVVERDQRRLHLPRYDLRDEQPELNQDSRVVRVRTEDEEEEPEYEEKDHSQQKPGDSETSSSSTRSYTTPDDLLVRALSRVNTTRSRKSKHLEKSPANVFPVYGMGAPSEREQSIAAGPMNEFQDADDTLGLRDETRPVAQPLGERLRRSLTHANTTRDLEASPHRRSSIDSRRSVSTINFPKQLRKFSFGRANEAAAQRERVEINNRLARAGITPKAANAANEAAGVSDYFGQNYPLARSSMSNLGIHFEVSHSPRPMEHTNSSVAPNDTSVPSEVPSEQPSELQSTNASSLNVREYNPN